MLVGDKIVHEKLENDATKLNVLLDLDNTIIYSKLYNKNDTINFCDESYLTILCEHVTHNTIYQIHVRNKFSEFLLELKKHFNIYIYTMATFDYASSICHSLEHILKTQIFSGIIARDGDHHGQSKYFYSLKYLNEKNTIVIDDNINVWIDDNKKNLIQIKKFKYVSYENYLADNELSILQQIITKFINDIKNNNLHETIKNINLHYNNYNNYNK